MKLRVRAKRQYLELSDTSSDIDVFTPSSEESVANSSFTTSDSTEDEQQLMTMDIVDQEDSDCVVLTPSIPVTTSPLHKQAPYKTIRTMDAIYHFLCERVKNQPALITVASAISAAINRSLMGDASKINKVDTLTLAGTSGCGKTETVLAIKHLLGMDRGYEYANQFDFIDGSTMSEPMQVNNICGAPSGTIGYGDGYTIADRLNKTINKATEKKKKNDTRRKYPMLKDKKKSADKKIEEKYVPPPFIMLFIDELHMVSLDFMKAINGLIDTAEYATPNGKAHFVKPMETTFIIIFTCNYGAKAIASLQPRNDLWAAKYIDDHMRDDGVPTNTIGRLGTICPYYPLEEDALRLLLAERLNNHVQQTALSSSFGKNQSIRVTEEASDMLVAHVLKQVNSDLGVRGAMKELLQKVDLLCEKAFSILHERTLLFPSQEELIFTGHTIPLKCFEDGTQEWHPMIALIKKNPANLQGLALAQAFKDEIQQLETIGIKRGTELLCQFIMPINRAMPDESISQSTQEEGQELEMLRKKIACITELVETATNGNRGATIRHIKNLVESENPLKRKQEMTENNDIKLKKPRHLVNLCCQYNLQTKRYSYKCMQCNIGINPQKTDVHICSS